jgi:hypothetical protein
MQQDAEECYNQIITSLGQKIPKIGDVCISHFFLKISSPQNSEIFSKSILTFFSSPQNSEIFSYFFLRNMKTNPSPCPTLQSVNYSVANPSLGNHTLFQSTYTS